jgi:putative hydrolase of the HAD superfamily
MTRDPAITCLFVDIGGVLLSNGWDHHARRRAATHFRLDFDEMEDRHHLTVDIYEEGRLSLDDYLGRVVFHQDRRFTKDEFRQFMFNQSTAFPEMIDLISQLKVRCNLKVAVVSNEGRELNQHRVREFKLGAFVDFFISSCFLHVRKPDAEIFRLALDIAQVPPQQIVYIENTPMFVQVAEDLGICSVLHKDYSSTCAQLASHGLHSAGGALLGATDAHRSKDQVARAKW